MRYALTIWFLILCQFSHAQCDFYAQLNNAALDLTKQDVTYDPGYFSIPYPNGDVPGNRGVCTDVIIRAYRKLGIDLQKEVHEDMKANFSITHIGFVVNFKSPSTDRYQVVHNIGAGQVLEDCLFKFKIIGHYRYTN